MSLFGSLEFKYSSLKNVLPYITVKVLCRAEFVKCYKHKFWSIKISTEKLIWCTLNLVNVSVE